MSNCLNANKMGLKEGALGQWLCRAKETSFRPITEVTTLDQYINRTEGRLRTLVATAIFEFYLEATKQWVDKLTFHPSWGAFLWNATA